MKVASLKQQLSVAVNAQLHTEQQLNALQEHHELLVAEVTKVRHIWGQQLSGSKLALVLY